MQIKRKVVKTLKPTKAPNTMRKAIDYGYSEPYATKISETKELRIRGKKPVAKDTNKTRRKMIKPTKKSTYS